MKIRITDDFSKFSDNKIGKSNEFCYNNKEDKETKSTFLMT